MIILVKGYLVSAEFVPEDPFGVFYRLAHCDPSGLCGNDVRRDLVEGNATLVASANVVSAGISAAHGRPISFAAFLRYGLPITVCQLAMSALYVWILYVVVRS